MKVPASAQYLIILPNEFTVNDAQQLITGTESGSAVGGG